MLQSFREVPAAPTDFFLFQPLDSSLLYRECVKEEEWQINNLFLRI